MLVEVASDADAGEVMTVQRTAYVSEAQLYDNPHLSGMGLGRRLLLAVEERVAPTLTLVHLEKPRP